MKGYKTVIILLVLLAISMSAWGNGGSDAEKDSKMTLEFIQWWEPEMPEGSLAAVVEEYEAMNPNIDIKLVSLPYNEVMDQILVHGSGGTLTPLVGINPNNIKTYNEFGFLHQLDDLLERDGMNKDDYAIKLVDGETWIMPVTSFLYGIYYNKDMLAAAGYSEPPATAEEFLEIAEACSNPSQGEFGYGVPLSLASPNGGTNDVLPWAWSAGAFTMENGRANFTDERFIDAFDNLKYMSDNDILSPGTLAKKEQEKVEEFKNGRIAMMISTTAHINLLKRGSDINFGFAPIPGPEGYTGKLASPVASWDVGISSNTVGEEKEAAWDFIKYFSSAEVNSKVATAANAFPGNKTGAPDFDTTDENFQTAMKVFTDFSLRSPLVGLPDAKELRTILNEELHALLMGDQDSMETAENATERWNTIIDSK